MIWYNNKHYSGTISALPIISSPSLFFSFLKRREAAKAHNEKEANKRAAFRKSEDDDDPDDDPLNRLERMMRIIAMKLPVICKKPFDVPKSECVSFISRQDKRKQHTFTNRKGNFNSQFHTYRNGSKQAHANQCITSIHQCQHTGRQGEIHHKHSYTSNQTTRC